MTARPEKVMLGPLIIHDGTVTAKHSAEAIRSVCPPSTEIIDTSTPDGAARIDAINCALLDGTLDFSMPPLWFTCKGDALASD